jgi:hypothetical protein
LEPDFETTELEMEAWPRANENKRKRKKKIEKVDIVIIQPNTKRNKIIPKG